jgi:UDP-N-acetyl-D-galactosamine dehydrogenase
MIKKLTSKSKISIIGMGYVGLPLADKLSAYFKVVGFDINKKRIDQLKKNNDVNCQVKDLNLKKKILFTNNSFDLSKSDLFIITVPTPVYKNKEPNLEPLLKATAIVANYIKKNSIIVYESTVFPGCTKKYCVPILSKISGLKFNSDYFCGYSPERINVGDKINTIDNIVKIVSGSDKASTNVIKEVYQKVVKNKKNIHVADSIETAEAAKVIENIQRDLNIALVNELAIIFNKLDLDVNKILEAASTKWNFIRFKPGLVGGHCIGVDPYYLTHICKKINYNPKVILSGRNLNESMSLFVKSKFIKLLNKNFGKKKKFKVLILGVTFKENCNDIRNSKVFDLINHLKKECRIDVYDPYVKELKIKNVKLVKKLCAVFKYEGIIHAVNHKIFINKLKNIKKFANNKAAFFSINNFQFQNIK